MTQHSAAQRSAAQRSTASPPAHLEVLHLNLRICLAPADLLFQLIQAGRHLLLIQQAGNGLFRQLLFLPLGNQPLPHPRDLLPAADLQQHGEGRPWRR